MDISKELNKKGADIAEVASEVISHPEKISELIEGVGAPKGSVRYAHEKVLRLISEERPELVYPYFDTFVDLLDNSNSFLKWGGIWTISNLTAVDTDNKFDEVFEKYYSFVSGPVMISAANVLGGSVKIVLNKPELADRIVQKILQVEKAKYKKQGKLSPECRNVAIGQAINTFDQIFEVISDKEAVVDFVKRQLDNKRKTVVKNADKFIKKNCE